MLTTFLTYIQTGFRFQGLEIFSRGEEHHFALLLLRKEKDELIVEKQQVHTDWDSLAQSLESSIPICICFAQKEIITKRVEATNEKRPEALVNQVFPNIDLESVFYQVYALADTKFVSIAKKEPVLEYLKKLDSLKARPISLSIGLSTIAPIIPFFSASEIVTNSTVVQFRQGNETLTGLLPNKMERAAQYEVNGMKLESQYLIAFGSVLAFISKNVENSTNLSVLNNKLLAEYIGKRKLSILAKFAVVFLLAVLLINFLFFSYYFDKVGELRELSIVTDSNKSTYRQLEERVLAKEERLRTILSNSDSKTSYYLDELASIVPSSVKFERLTFQPLKTPVRQDKAISIEEDVILVAGTTSNQTSYTEWIQSLEGFTWIRSVETTDFDYVTDTITKFGIKISVDE